MWKTSKSSPIVFTFVICDTRFAEWQDGFLEAMAEKLSQKQQARTA